MTRATPPTFLAILRAALVQVRGDLRPAFVGAGIFTAFLPALLILWLSRLNLIGTQVWRCRCGWASRESGAPPTPMRG